MAPSEVSREELLKLVVEEVDQARDLYQLVEQLAPYLPIRSFDDLVKSSRGKRMRFRDADFDVESLREYVPTVVLPAEDLRGLVERLGHLVRMIPAHLGVDVSTESGAKRQVRSSGELARGLGRIPSQRMATATVVGAMFTPPQPPKPDA